MGKFRGDRCPGEHGGLRQGHLPPRLGQALHQHFATLAVKGAGLFHTVLGTVKRRRRRHLDRGEGAVIHIGLDARQGGDEIAVAEPETDAPARHGIGLAQGIELDGHILGTGHLEDGGWRLVKINLGIGVVGNHIEIMVTAEIHHAGVEIQIHHFGGGIGWKIDDQPHGVG